MTRFYRTLAYTKITEEEWNDKYFYFLIDNIDQKINWNFVSRSEYITPKIVMDSYEKQLDIPWSYLDLSLNPNITIDFIKNNLDKRWDWFQISRNSNIHLHDIENNLDLPWDWSGVSLNPNITIPFIKKYINKTWDWRYLSRNSNIFFKDILDNLDLPWLLDNITFNPNLTIKDIDNNPSFNWNWKYISMMKNIPLNYILNNLDKDWDFNQLSHTNINDIINNLDLPWNWDILTHQNSLKDIYYNIDLPWNWDIVYYNHGLFKSTIDIYRIKSKNFTKSSSTMTMDDLLKEEIINYDDYNSDDTTLINYWHWGEISRKSNIRMNEINEHADLPWVWYDISINKFSFERNEFILNKYKEYMAAYKIQQRWNECISNPEYQICRRKLVYDYNKYFKP